MPLFDQKIHWKSIWSQVGLLLHVPAVMATISLLICIIFKEWFAVIPLIFVALIGFGVGQLFYRIFLSEKTKAHLWDAMIIAALGWLFCSILSAVPFYLIAVKLLSLGLTSEALEVFSHPINALFESFSGYTSTGLTMLQKQGYFPHILQWWRSFLEWTGGLGLVVFILSMTHLNKMGYQLYYAEARTEQMSSNITRTAHWIWAIYLLYTSIGALLFLTFGMGVWEAINHSMTVISTGGFSITSDSFESYSLSIRIIAMVMMVVGSISFAVHFRIINEGNFKIIWKSLQTRLLIFFVIGGGIFITLLNIWNHTNGAWINSYFEWISALTTCGYSSTHLSFFSPMVKLFLIFGMFIGGAAGSTAGGLKLRRLCCLVSGVFLRLKTITDKKENLITKDYRPSKQPKKIDPPGTDLPKSQKSERLFTASVLFFLWTFTLLVGWFLILRWTPNGQALDALFEVASAFSNVGLTSGLLTPEFSSFGKSIFMFLMWIGRLEIIPAIILFLSIPMSVSKRA